MLTLIFAVTLASAPAQEDARVPALTNAEDCLRANVAAAVGSNASAIDAAEFLLSYLCAAPVNTAAKYEFNTKLLNTVMGLSADRSAAIGTSPAADEAGAGSNEGPPPSSFFSSIQAQVDPITGEIVVSKSAFSDSMVSLLQSQAGPFDQLTGYAKPVFLRELAGRLVLEAQRR